MDRAGRRPDIIKSFPGIVDVARASRAVPRPRRRATWPARPASGSSSTSAPACRPRTTPTRSPSGWPRTARVVYVDNDPLVLAHARALLTSAPARASPPTSTPTCATQTPSWPPPPDAGLRPADRTDVAGHPGARRRRRRGASIVRRLVDALPSGSYLATSTRVGTTMANPRPRRVARRRRTAGCWNAPTMPGWAPARNGRICKTTFASLVASISRSELSAHRLGTAHGPLAAPPRRSPPTAGVRPPGEERLAGHAQRDPRSASSGGSSGWRRR